MKYQEGQRVKVIAGRFIGDVGTITRVDENDPFLTYRMDFDDGRIQWYSADMIVPDELQQLRSAHEALKATLKTIYAEISQWSQIQTPPDADTSVALIARIESLVSEALEPNELP
jgi:hypothetical protein